MRSCSNDEKKHQSGKLNHEGDKAQQTGAGEGNATTADGYINNSASATSSVHDVDSQKRTMSDVNESSNSGSFPVQAHHKTSRYPADNDEDNSTTTSERDRENNEGHGVRNRTFEMFTRRTPSYITVTLSVSPTSTSTTTSTHAPSSTSDHGSKRELLRIEWEETCLKWGLVVVRQLTYIQNTFSDIVQESDPGNQDTKANIIRTGESDKLIINGIEASKEKDELVISRIMQPSYAHSAGIHEGDVIDAVYGMKSPNLGLLFGIMRDSLTFQLTVKRMETKYERDVRMGNASVDVSASVNLAASDGHSLIQPGSALAACGDNATIKMGKLDANATAHTNVNTSEEQNANENDVNQNKISNDARAKAMEECMKDLDPDLFQFSDDDVDNDNDVDNNNSGVEADDSNVDQDLFGESFDDVSNRDESMDFQSSGVASVTDNVPANESKTSEGGPSNCVDTLNKGRRQQISDEDGGRKGTNCLTPRDTEMLEKESDFNNALVADRDTSGDTIDNTSMEVQQQESVFNDSVTVNELTDPGVTLPLQSACTVTSTPAVNPDVESNHNSINEPTSPITGKENENMASLVVNEVIEKDSELNAPNETILNPRNKQRGSTEVDNNHSTPTDTNTALTETRDETSRHSTINYDPQHTAYLSDSSHQIDIHRDNHFDVPAIAVEIKEEELLTSLIEDSIKSKETRRDKKSQKKLKKRKMSEDSSRSISSKQEKKSKSKRKKKKDSHKSVNDVEADEPVMHSSTSEQSSRNRKKDKKNLSTCMDEESIETPRQDSMSHQKGLSESISNGRPPRKESVDEGKRKRRKDRSVNDDANTKTLDRSSAEEGHYDKDNQSVSKNGVAKARAAVVSTLGRQRIDSLSSIDFSMNNDDGGQKRPYRASPLTIPRASPLTVSRHKSKVTVSSTSSKAGLGAVKSAKLKRLWPDSSLFSKRVLKWRPPQVVMEDFKVFFKGSPKSNVDGKKLPVIPSTFRDTSEIIKFMSPHILEEGVHATEQEFLSNSDRNGIWTREIFSMHLRHCTPVDPRPITGSSPSVRTYEFAFRLDSNSGLQPPSNLGEIFVVHSPSWKQPSCLGIIGSNDINSTFLADQKVDDDDSYDLFKLWICICGDPVDDTGWLPDADMPPKNPDGSFPPQTMYALNIGTSTDMMRQYEGLKSLASVKSSLKKALYNMEKDNGGDNAPGGIIDTLPSKKIMKPSSVCATVWDKLKDSTNPFQLSAIEKIMSGKVKDNIALMQGPPGTGKTSTTVAIVSALLNGSAPVPGTKSSGTRVQIGNALQNSSGGNVNHNSVVAKRILVCAPSNQAVDELAWKIHNSAIGGNGKVGGFNMVRFGMLPGDERHDGRGKRSSQRASGFHDNQRDKFLSAINLDKMVRDVASGREIHDFRHSGKQKQGRKDDTSRKSRYINFNVERQKILSHCHVVCSTLSGAGSKAFIESGKSENHSYSNLLKYMSLAGEGLTKVKCAPPVSRDEFPHSEFDAVIIDEACQGSEMSCLIPFKYNPNAVVLVGDPNQLPVMTFSQDASRCKADRSLFDRLHLTGLPINMLRIQYRMHPAIVQFPSKTFYNNKIITCDKINNRRPAIWHDHVAFPPYLLWNLRDGVMNRGNNGGISNSAEASFVVRLLKTFAHRYGNVRNISIGVISFYSEQVARIKDRVQDQDLLRWMKSNKISLQISTVDGFQGSEKDIIILSCVRSRWMGQNARSDIGFLKDFRRVNVALTRAKYSLWVIAHCDTLRKDALWNDLVNDAYNRNLIAESNVLNDFAEGGPRRKKSTKKKRKPKKKKDSSSEGQDSKTKLEK